MSARAAALGEMAALLHRMRTDPALARRRSQRAEQEALSRAAARQPARDPPRLAARPMRCPKRWCSAASWPRRAASMPGAHSARPTTGRASCANFREVLAIAREEAELLSQHSGQSRYDALMDRLRARHDAAPRWTGVFGEVRSWLPGLIRQVRERQASAAADRAGGTVSAGRRSAACASGHRPARFRLRRRPAGREHASVLRRRAGGRAHDHALPRRRFPAAA